MDMLAESLLSGGGSEAAAATADHDDDRGLFCYERLSEEEEEEGGGCRRGKPIVTEVVAFARRNPSTSCEFLIRCCYRTRRWSIRVWSRHLRRLHGRLMIEYTRHRSLKSFPLQFSSALRTDPEAVRIYLQAALDDPILGACRHLAEWLEVGADLVRRPISISAADNDGDDCGDDDAQRKAGWLWARFEPIEIEERRILFCIPARWIGRATGAVSAYVVGRVRSARQQTVQVAFIALLIFLLVLCVTIFFQFVTRAHSQLAGGVPGGVTALYIVDTVVLFSVIVLLYRRKRPKRYWAVLRHSALLLFTSPNETQPVHVFLLDELLTVRAVAMASPLRVLWRGIIVGTKGWKLELVAADRLDQREWARRLAGAALTSPWCNPEIDTSDLGYCGVHREANLCAFASREMTKVWATDSMWGNDSMWVGSDEGRRREQLPFGLATAGGMMSVLARLRSRRRRFGSFAPPRPHTLCQARWLVDGDDTFAAIYDALDAAETSILIAGWWISPELYLKRPAEDHRESRLDRVLQRKANQGVEIFVLVYKEPSVVLNLNSAHTKARLRELHGSNIHVMRDPEFIVEMLGYWSHHEKVVCVDQKVAFVGGLDLAFGRWDIAEHPLAGGPGGESQREDHGDYPGIDYANPRIKDFAFRDVQHASRDILDRACQWRMPWHDVHVCVEGQVAIDVARHFIGRWNFSRLVRGKLNSMPPIVPAADLPQGPQDAGDGRVRTREMWRIVEEDTTHVQRFFLADLDYVNYSLIFAIYSLTVALLNVPKNIALLVSTSVGAGWWGVTGLVNIVWNEQFPYPDIGVTVAAASCFLALPFGVVGIYAFAKRRLREARIYTLWNVLYIAVFIAYYVAETLIGVPGIYCAAPAFVYSERGFADNLMVGQRDGSMAFFKNAGNETEPNLIAWDSASGLSQLSVDSYSTPAALYNHTIGNATFPGILAVGDGDGGVWCHTVQPNSTCVDPNVCVDACPRNIFDEVQAGGGRAAPKLQDLDADQIDELVVGTGDGTVQIYSFDSNSSTFKRLDDDDPSNPMKAVNIFIGDNGLRDSKPALWDIDNDTRVDLLVGFRGTNKLVFFPNCGTPSRAQFFPLEDLPKNSNCSFLHTNPFEELEGNDNFRDVAPVFWDAFGDGVADLVIGTYAGHLNFYLNEGNATHPLYAEYAEAKNPLRTVEITTFSDQIYAGIFDIYAVLGILMLLPTTPMLLRAMRQMSRREADEEDEKRGATVRSRASSGIAEALMRGKDGPTDDDDDDFGARDITRDPLVCVDDALSDPSSTRASARGSLTSSMQTNTSFTPSNASINTGIILTRSANSSGSERSSLSQQLSLNGSAFLSEHGENAVASWCRRLGHWICCKSQREASHGRRFGLLRSESGGNAIPALARSVRLSPATEGPQLAVASARERMDRLPRKEGFWGCRCQVVRSVSRWSAAVPRERSIQDAYCELIRHSEHFIYIENQFFVSAVRRNDPEIANTVAHALLQRIRRAIAERTPFKVMVVIPLLPGVEGGVDDTGAHVLHEIMHYQYRTICRGDDSLLGTLRARDGISEEEIERRIQFFGLRTHGPSPSGQNMWTEMVYVHSKLMIVDDRSVVLGSANINERSMSGDKDSEIALVLEPPQGAFHDLGPSDHVPGLEIGDVRHSRMAGRRFVVSTFAQELRKRLWAEHFGLQESRDVDVTDPASDDVWSALLSRARQNESSYDRAAAAAPGRFVVVPNDSIKTFADTPHREVVNLTSAASQKGDECACSFEEALAEVRGHAVPLPLHFLEEENLHSPFYTEVSI